MLLARRNHFANELAKIDPFADFFDGTTQHAAYQPLIDIVENETAYRVTLEVPGISKEDISLEVEDGLLTVSGEKKSETTDENQHYYRQERRYGEFSRTVKFRDIDAEKISATHAAGVLTVTLPKTEAAKPKKIDIG